MRPIEHGDDDRVELPLANKLHNGLGLESYDYVVDLNDPAIHKDNNKLEFRIDSEENNTDEPTQPVQQHEPTNVQAPLVPNISPLIPTRLAPKMRLPKMVQLWAFLNRIERVAIGDVYTTPSDDDSHGTVYYVLDVYCYQEQQGLPTRRYETVERRTTSPPPQRRPDFQVHHSFSSFVKLRRRIQKATHAKHISLYQARGSSARDCAYCQHMRHTMSVAPLGWKTKFFTTVETRRTLLSQFITELLVLARRQRETCCHLEILAIVHQPASTYVDRSVPGLVRSFMTPQTGDNYMR